MKNESAKDKKTNSLSLDYLPNHPDILIYQDRRMIRINTDTEVLGEFIEVYKEDTVLDVGTNNGALLLYANRFNPKKLIGIDINEEAIKIARLNMSLNKIDNFELKVCDAMEYSSEEVDVIICNPPYFKTKENNLSDNDYLNLAKHETRFTIKGLINTAYKNLKPNGVFYMLFQTSRLQEVLYELYIKHFSVKQIKFVYDENKEYSNVFMIKCVKHGLVGLNALKPIIIKR